MADISILDSAVHAAPKAYLIKGAQEIVLKGVSASFDGTGAAGSFVPAVQVVDPVGFIVGTYTADTTLAAGASADVTWFPGVGVGTLSTAGVVQFDIKVFADTAALVVADNAFIFAIPSDLNGAALTAADAYVTTVSSAGLPTVQVRNVTTGHDMLSTPITIDVSEFTSYTAATPPVINPSFAVVSTADRIAIDVDVSGTGALGLGVILTLA